jgi:tetratricopeptide (TPR) repeat protein
LTERQLRYWRDSETLFRHTLAVTRFNPKAHLNLAIALDQEDRLPEALAEYLETIRMEPYRYQIHFNIGRILEKLGEPTEALAEFREAIRSDPKIATWHFAAGNALIALGREDEGLNEFAEALRLKPDYAQPHIETAKLFFRQGRDEQAVAALNAALKAEPDRFQTLAVVARYLIANENFPSHDVQTALALARKADELSGHSQPVVLDTLGMTYAATGDFIQAQASAQNAIELATAAQLKDVEAMRQRLELYKKNQPWREYFRATNGSVQMPALK